MTVTVDASTLSTANDASDPVLADADAGENVLPEAGVDGPCDTAEVPDSEGVFVSRLQGDDESAGTQQSPVKTISRALGLADEGQRRNVYIAEGQYEEATTLVVRTAVPLRMSGAWQNKGGQWTRNCETGRRLRTAIYVSSSPALTDEPKLIAGNTVTLEGLTVVAKKSASAASPIALYLNDEGSDWMLTDAALVADHGRDGASAPAVVANATPAGACTVCGDGSTGAPGVAMSGKVTPAFSPDGFVIGRGGDGEAGKPGEPGTAGGPAQSDGKYNTTCPTKTPPDCYLKAPQIPVSSGEGKCGCGGQGGQGGQGGEGGGASVALYVSGNRKVTAAYTQMKTVGGGNGGKGANGAAGQPGGEGVAGDSVTYNPRTCINSGGSCGPSSGEGVTT
ncbi:MAG TPA: DUF1565 domain-containing protein, partial [Labilithrix sp.]|nr:DUF1565 domain-containing protein [Labilithrix sp.]